MNFARSFKKRKFLFFKPEFLHLVVNQGYGSFEKNIKFQLYISKLMSARPEKPNGTWDVNTTIII